MKVKSALLLVVSLTASVFLIAFSGSARAGALDGLKLAENTIIPSLMPLLILFYFVMKSGGGDLLSRAFGVISTRVFNLPQNTFPAIFFGLIGGYPTGALLTDELLSNGSIDKVQARRLLRFNMCGGCGFIITAVGSATYKSTAIGTVLFLSNVLAALSVGIILSFTQKRKRMDFFSYTEHISLGDALIDATNSSVRAVLNMTAYIILFSAVSSVVGLPDFLVPVFEITSGICTHNPPPLAITAMFLSFGGLCIHLQLLPVVLKAGMSYLDFITFRVINALFSYAYTKLILVFVPVNEYVFSNTSNAVFELSSVNTALSVLLVAGCFVIVSDVFSRVKASY